MKYRNIYLLLSLVAILAVTGCSKHRGFKKTDDGLYYKFHVKSDDTTTVKEGMILNIKLKYSINDSVLFNSDLTQRDLMLSLDPPTYKGDLFSGLAMMKPGDSATFISSADSFFIVTMKRPELLDSTFKGKDIFFHVKMISANTREQLEKEQKAELDKLKAQEEASLKDYIAKNNVTTTPLASGLYFTELKKGNGHKPSDGQYGKIRMKVSNVEGDVLYNGFDSPDPMYWKKGEPFDNQGVTEALSLMSKGSRASVIVPSSLAFGEQGRGQIPPYTTLFYELELIDVITEAQLNKERADREKKAAEEREKAIREEPVKLQSYLKQNNIKVAPTASGLYYIETQKGTGPQATPGKKVSVHYTGKFIDGTEFDSSRSRGEPFSFVLGQGQVIPGWDEGISLMRKGGKAQLIIPSKIGYGEGGQPPRIPASATLVFDVELVDVK